MTESDAARLLAELAAQYGEQPYDPDRDITVADVMRSQGISEDRARNQLEYGIEQGLLVKRKAQVKRGPPINVYRRPG